MKTIYLKYLDKLSVALRDTSLLNWDRRCITGCRIVPARSTHQRIIGNDEHACLDNLRMISLSSAIQTNRKLYGIQSKNYCLSL